MQYLLLIYREEAAAERATKGDQEAMHNEYGAFTQAIIKSGHFKAGDALQPIRTATTVRVRGGKALTTDGPFAETTEQLGGYFLIDAADLDEAISIAGRIPGAKWGTVEIRPVIEVPNMPTAE